jgi:hypothetical protein
MYWSWDSPTNHSYRSPCFILFIDVGMNDLVCIAHYCQVGTVSHNDYLTWLACLPQTCHQHVINSLIIQIVLRLVNDQRNVAAVNQQIKINSSVPRSPSESSSMLLPDHFSWYFRLKYFKPKIESSSSSGLVPDFNCSFTSTGDGGDCRWSRPAQNPLTLPVT